MIAAVSLAALASIVSFATEPVGERFGPAVTGVLQSTLGNLPEFFIVLFALGAGQVVVAQTSVVGSLFANALLVLGLVIIVGARRDGIMRFRARLPQDTATLLLSASFMIVLAHSPSARTPRPPRQVATLSAVGAIALLAVYGAWLWADLRSDEPVRCPRVAGERGPPRSASGSGGGGGRRGVRLRLVRERAPARDGGPRALGGLLRAGDRGHRRQRGRARGGRGARLQGQGGPRVSVVKNSVAQVAAFLFPPLVLLSLFFEHPLTFVLAAVYIGALPLTAIALWQITGDGEATDFEGLALIAMYVTLGAFAWLGWEGTCSTTSA